MTKHSNKPFLAVTGGVFAVVLSGIASAQTSGAPSSIPSGSTSASPSGFSSAMETVAATQLISSTSLTQMMAISNAISFRPGGLLLGPPGARADSGQRMGMAAGGAAPMSNVWGSVSGDTFKYTPAGGEVKLDTTNTIFGTDYAIIPTVTVGVSIAFDRSTGPYTTVGHTIAPYIGWQINKDWSLDAMAGWGKSDANGIKPDRLFYGGNLSYTTWGGNWQVSAKGSYLYGEEKKDWLKSQIDQWRLGLRLGYWMDGILPYFAMSFSSDNPKASGVSVGDLGKTAVVSSLGVDFISIKNNLTGGIVLSTETGRSNGKRDSAMANINYRF